MTTDNVTQYNQRGQTSWATNRQNDVVPGVPHTPFQLLRGDRPAVRRAGAVNQPHTREDPGAPGRRRQHRPARTSHLATPSTRARRTARWRCPTAWQVGHTTRVDRSAQHTSQPPDSFGAGRPWARQVKLEDPAACQGHYTTGVTTLCPSYRGRPVGNSTSRWADYPRTLGPETPYDPTARACSSPPSRPTAPGLDGLRVSPRSSAATSCRGSPPAPRAGSDRLVRRPGRAGGQEVRPDTLRPRTGVWNDLRTRFQRQPLCSAAPELAITQVTDHQTKFGNISTQGLGGTQGPEAKSRRLQQVPPSVDGQAVVTATHDNLRDRTPDYYT